MAVRPLVRQPRGETARAPRTGVLFGLTARLILLGVAIAVVGDAVAAALDHWVQLATTLTIATGAPAALRWRDRHRRPPRFVAIQVPAQVDPAGADTLWSNLTALLRPAWRRLLLGQPHVSFEFRWTEGGVKIGLWIPGGVPAGLVQRAVEAAWPGARTEVVDPTPPVPTSCRAAGGMLRLAEHHWFPLRTKHDADPLRALFGAARGLGAGEVVAVQILARPTTSRRFRRLRHGATALRYGYRAGVGRLGIITTYLAWQRRRAAWQWAWAPPDPYVTADIRTILQKASGPGWEVAVHYGVATQAPRRVGRRWLSGRAHAVASSFGVHTGRNWLRRRRLWWRPADALAGRRMSRGDLLSVPELAALAHLPLDAGLPELARAGARSVAPVAAVAETGKVLGHADAGPARRVALSVADARYHLHVAGPTGCGKSTALLNLILDDAAAGRGVVLVEPKGDLVRDVIERLPASAVGRVVLIDPDDNAPPSLNVLEGPHPDVAVDNLVGIFRRIFGQHFGPRTEDIMRSACLTLLRRPNATLAGLPRLLADDRFRQPYLTGLDDPAGLGGFWTWYEGLSIAERAQSVGPLLNKLRAILLRPFVRQVIGSSRSSFDMAAVLDGAICLVRVPKGALGDDTARLLGSLVVAKVWQAAMARARLPEDDRHDATLYVDEAHNFLNLPRSYEEMFAEARGYRLSVVVAHQHLGQLSSELRDALATNARSKLYFTADAATDARFFASHVAPQLSAHDLAHLGAYQAAARLVVGGQQQPACTLRTRPAPPAIPGRADAVRAAAQTRYGRTEAQRRGDEAATRPTLRVVPGAEEPRTLNGESPGHVTSDSADEPWGVDPNTGAGQMGEADAWSANHSADSTPSSLSEDE